MLTGQLGMVSPGVLTNLGYIFGIPWDNFAAAKINPRINFGRIIFAVTVPTYSVSLVRHHIAKRVNETSAGHAPKLCHSRVSMLPSQDRKRALQLHTRGYYILLTKHNYLGVEYKMAGWDQFGTFL